VSTMWIRVKKDGFIYPYDEILAKNSSCEVVPEEVAFPHKAITPAVQAAIEYYTVDVTQPLPPAPAPAVAERRVRGRPRKAPLDLSTPEVLEPPVYTSPELAQDASKGLP
jgi:hypothetical protein